MNAVGAVAPAGATRGARVRWTVAAWLGAGLVLSPPWAGGAQAAEESGQGHIVATLVRFEALPGGDAEGHSVGLFENRGAIVHDDGRVGQIVTRGTFEFAQGVATYRGYAVLDYEDGARAFAEVQGTYDATGEMAIDRGKFTFTGGEEALQGLGGEGTFSGRALAPVDDGGTLYYTWTVTATLPE